MRRSALVALAVLAGWNSPALAQEVRYVNRDGITYRETVERVKKPVSETTYQTYNETVYKERYTTKVQESQRTYLAPVTEYQWEAYTPVTLNIFAPPRVAYRWVPRTRWETRSETVRTPVTRRDLVPEERTVSRPQTSLRMVEEERITRIAIADPPSGQPAANVASREVIGGVSNLQNDPPRSGTSFAPGGLRR